MGWSVVLDWIKIDLWTYFFTVYFSNSAIKFSDRETESFEIINSKEAWTDINIEHNQWKTSLAKTFFFLCKNLNFTWVLTGFRSVLSNCTLYTEREQSRKSSLIFFVFQGWVEPTPSCSPDMQPNSVVHIVQKNIMYGRDPVQITCPNCKAAVSYIATRVNNIKVVKVPFLFMF